MQKNASVYELKGNWMPSGSEFEDENRHIPETPTAPPVARQIVYEGMKKFLRRQQELRLEELRKKTAATERKEAIRREVQLRRDVVSKISTIKEKVESFNPEEYLQYRKKISKELKALKALLSSAKILYQTSPFKPIPSWQRLIIDIDYVGAIREKNERPSLDKMSDFYREYRKTNRNGAKKTYSADKYNLSASPAWVQFRRFPNFKKVEARLIEHMGRTGIPPKRINELKVEDYVDMLFREFHDYKKTPGAAFLFVGMCKVGDKRLVAEHEKQLRKMLKEKCWPPNYIDDLVEHLKDESKIDDFEVKNENGDTLPYFKFVRHHKIGRTNAAYFENIDEVNHYENLMWCIASYHDLIIHGFDTVYRDEDGTYKRDYMVFEKPDIVLMCGLCPLQQLYSDYTEEVKNLDHKEKAQKRFETRMMRKKRKIGKKRDAREVGAFKRHGWNCSATGSR